MADLRSHVLRVAADLPVGDPTRRKILAVLREGGRDWKPLVSNDKVRIQWQDHPGNSLMIQELPTKPVKRRLRRATVETQMWVHHLGTGAGDHFLMSNILRDAKLTSSMNYDQAVNAMRQAVEKAKQRAISDERSSFTEDWFKKFGWGSKWWFNEDDVYFLEVEPTDYKPVSFAGRDFGGKSEWNSFTFYDDKDDDEYMRQMEGMRAFYESTSAAPARKLFKLLKADPDAVKRMDIKQFKALLDKNKIAYKYVPTVWR